MQALHCDAQAVAVRCGIDGSKLASIREATTSTHNAHIGELVTFAKSVASAGTATSGGESNTLMHRKVEKANA